MSKAMMEKGWSYSQAEKNESWNAVTGPNANSRLGKNNTHTYIYIHICHEPPLIIVISYLNHSEHVNHVPVSNI